MKVILQRVSEASVSVEDKTIGEINHGILFLLGVMEGDTAKEAQWLAEKCSRLRIFSDDNGKMNHSLLDVQGEALVVSNFTLCADAKKGNRPSYTRSALPESANNLYEYFADTLVELGVSKVARGIFGADMAVSLVNDGPVTLILDTDEIMPKK